MVFFREIAASLGNPVVLAAGAALAIVLLSQGRAWRIRILFSVAIGCAIVIASRFVGVADEPLYGPVSGLPLSRPLNPQTGLEPAILAGAQLAGVILIAGLVYAVLRVVRAPKAPTSP